jgi:hypothetical protein
MRMRVYKCDLKISADCKGEMPSKEYSLHMIGHGIKTHFPKARGLDVCSRCLEVWAEKYWED